MGLRNVSVSRTSAHAAFIVVVFLLLLLVGQMCEAGGNLYLCLSSLSFSVETLPKPPVPTRIHEAGEEHSKEAGAVARDVQLREDLLLHLKEAGWLVWSSVRCVPQLRATRAALFPDLTRRVFGALTGAASLPDVAILAPRAQRTRPMTPNTSHAISLETETLKRRHGSTSYAWMAAAGRCHLEDHQLCGAQNCDRSAPKHHSFHKMSPKA